MKGAYLIPSSAAKVSAAQRVSDWTRVPSRRMSIVIAICWMALIWCSAILLTTGYGARPGSYASIIFPQKEATELQSSGLYVESSHTVSSEGVADEEGGRVETLGVMIKSRVTPDLVPLMLHFTAVLGPSWPLVLFTLENNWTPPNSAAFKRAVSAGQIRIEFLPPGTDVSSTNISKFLTAPWIWEQLESASRVLFLQTDSILCSKANGTLDDFLDYDFIGSPVDPEYGSGYHGGLSLRNPGLFLQIARDETFEMGLEHQWFYHHIQKRGGFLAAPEIAKLFSVGSMNYETPIGYHQPQRWQGKHIEQMRDYCPEISLLLGRRAI
ncbi:hypothetical protein GQ53DRAFT_842344 [Thozetella sp. PMI_491]|nr:hypothetical protein GQ53DRAFT_842344 [Thozetella sp. PMI_491]